MATETMPVASGTSPVVSPWVFPIVLPGLVALPISITGSAVAIPHIADDLGSRPFLLQGVLNAFNFAVAVTTIVWGAVSDRIG
jgi:MFS family permease